MHFLRFPSLCVSAFPISEQGRHLQNIVNEATSRFTCVTACNFVIEELTTPDCSDAAPLTTGVHGQFPGRDFNPLDVQSLLHTRCPYLVLLINCDKHQEIRSHTHKSVGAETGRTPLVAPFQPHQSPCKDRYPHTH